MILFEMWIRKIPNPFEERTMLGFGKRLQKLLKLLLQVSLNSSLGMDPDGRAGGIICCEYELSRGKPVTLRILLAVRPFK